MNPSLKQHCLDIRCDTLRAIGHLGVGHIGGCLSVIELLTVLYFEAMNIDPAQPKMPGRDRFICSKGHAGPAVYAALANRGFFPKEMLLTLNQGGTDLPSHCDMNRTPGIDMTTGSLGQGFSCAVGAALGSKLEGDGAVIYTLIGDGESQEGQIWEAAMFAAAKHLDHLIAFTD
ncbi:MAG: transketolase, partial [Oscillospiraceae bacterium]|nr:transketolase [Oscillospiraceae bacterium]